MVTVPGYNVDWLEAMTYALVLQVTMGRTGPTVCYAWPSTGVYTGYLADRAIANSLIGDFTTLLQDLQVMADIICGYALVLARQMMQCVEYA